VATSRDYKPAPDISSHPAHCHSSIKLSPPIPVTKIFTDRTKILHFKKSKPFEEILPSIDSEPNAPLANPLKKGFCRCSRLHKPGKRQAFTVDHAYKTFDRSGRNFAEIIFINPSTALTSLTA
jgi:hypothetical protein